MGEVHGFTHLRPPGWAIVGILATFAFTGSTVVLVPVVILIAVVTRAARRHRERRLAAIRLVGATQSQISLVAAAEAGVAAIGGAALGWALYEVNRRMLASAVTFQHGPFWLQDVALPPSWLAGILLAVPALVISRPSCRCAVSTRVPSRFSGARGGTTPRALLGLLILATRHDAVRFE